MKEQFLETQKAPVCKIINGNFSWVLEVDGKIIPFNGMENAEYFAELYTKLGYTIERETE